MDGDGEKGPAGHDTLLTENVIFRCANDTSDHRLHEFRSYSETHATYSKPFWHIPYTSADYPFPDWPTNVTGMAGPGFEKLILHQPEALLPELTYLKSWLDWCGQLLIQWPFKVTLKFVHRWRGQSCPVQSFSSSSERNAIWRAIALRNGSCHCNAGALFSAISWH